jgi:hypothetical protein
VEELLQNPQWVQEYHDRIEKAYDRDGLWAKRLQDICDLWE